MLHQRSMISLLLLLQLLQLLSCCWAAQPPRRLLACPAEFATLVEPLPEAAGEPLLLLGPGVQLRTVGFLQDSVLLVESNRVLVNGSAAADLMRQQQQQQQEPYSGPHVMLCSDPRQPMVTFSLFIKMTANDSSAPTPTADVTPTSQQAAADPSNSGDLSGPQFRLLLVLTAAVALLSAVCAVLAAAVAILLRRLRRSSAPQQRGKIFTGTSSSFKSLLGDGQSPQKSNCQGADNPACCV